MAWWRLSIDINHLTIALCPVVSSTAAVLGHINVLRVVEVCKRPVHDRVDDSWLQVQQHGSRNVVLIIGLTVHHHQLIWTKPNTNAKAM